MDLEPFSRIDPCGYPGLAVTQIVDRGVLVDIEAVGTALAARIAAALGLQPVFP